MDPLSVDPEFRTLFLKLHGLKSHASIESWDLQGMQPRRNRQTGEISPFNGPKGVTLNGNWYETNVYRKLNTGGRPGQMYVTSSEFRAVNVLAYDLLAVRTQNLHPQRIHGLKGEHPKTNWRAVDDNDFHFYDDDSPSLLVFTWPTLRSLPVEDIKSIFNTEIKAALQCRPDPGSDEEPPIFHVVR